MIRHKKKIILSLCDVTGNWPEPYRKIGYDIHKFDIQEGYDVRLLEIINEFKGKTFGVFSAPPCTHFCIGGAHLWEKKGKDPIMQGLSIVDACIRISVLVDPIFWVLENPMGRLHKYLGPPTYKFHPYWFGDPYTKYTYLWGRFNTNLKRNDVKPIKNYMNELFFKYPIKYLSFFRSMAPIGFANAFFEANH